MTCLLIVSAWLFVGACFAVFNWDTDFDDNHYSNLTTKQRVDMLITRTILGPLNLIRFL